MSFFAVLSLMLAVIASHGERSQTTLALVGIGFAILANAP